MSLTKINGINMDYTVTGQGDPLVMIMGQGFGQKGWRFQTKYFNKYFKVITFDNRGTGGSDKPEGPYTTRMMADDTVGLMDYLQIEKAHIVGVSMGGMIAQELAINYPQRVNKLVLGCTKCKQDNDASGDSPEWIRAMELVSQNNFDMMLNLLINKRLNRMIFIPIIKRAFKKMEKSDAIGFAGQRQACINHNTADRLSLIKAETLVIGGTGDKVLKPTSAKVISSLIPGSKLIMIEHGSHTLFMEMSGKFNQEILSFLRGV